MLLSDKITAIYCVVDDLLQACDHHTPEGCRCTDAEIITTALVSALLFKGNQSLTIDYMHPSQHGTRPSIQKWLYQAPAPAGRLALQSVSAIGSYCQRAQLLRQLYPR